MEPPIPPAAALLQMTQEELNAISAGSTTFRKHGAKFREAARNETLADHLLKCAGFMEEIAGDKGADKKDRTNAVKAYAQLITAHTEMQKNTLKMSDIELDEDVKATPTVRPPTPPRHVNIEQMVVMQQPLDTTRR